jgi:hypothetical protein
MKKDERDSLPWNRKRRFDFSAERPGKGQSGKERH